MHRPASAVLPAAAMLALAVVAGCSHADSTPEPDFRQPPVSDFREGPCRSMAPDVLAIGRDARGLGTSSSPPQATRDDLRAAQTRIRALQPSLDPSLTGPVEDLVVAVGAVRLRADSNAYTPALATDLTNAYQALVTACTTAS